MHTLSFAVVLSRDADYTRPTPPPMRLRSAQGDEVPVPPEIAAVLWEAIRGGAMVDVTAHSAALQALVDGRGQE